MTPSEVQDAHDRAVGTLMVILKELGGTYTFGSTAFDVDVSTLRIQTEVVEVEGEATPRVTMKLVSKEGGDAGISGSIH